MAFFGFFGPPDVEKLRIKRNVNGLIKALSDKDEGVRSSAAIALGQIRDVRAINPLIFTLNDDDRDVCINALKALYQIGPPAIKPLIATLKNENSRIHDTVAKILLQIGDDGVVEPLIAELGDENKHVRETAAKILQQIGVPAVKPLIAELRDDNSSIHENAAKVLQNIGSPAVKLLVTALMIRDDNFRYRVSMVLKQMGSPAIDTLNDALLNGDLRLRHGAADASGKIGDARGVDPLIITLGDMNEEVRMKAMEALGQIGTPAVVQLISALKHENEDVRESAAEVLEKMGSTAVVSLIFALTRNDTSGRRSAAELLGKIGDPLAVEPLLTVLKDTDVDVDVRIKASEALGKFGDVRAVEPLILILEGEQGNILESAAKALGQIGDSRAVEPLIDALAMGHQGLRSSAAEALGKIGDTRAVEPLRGAFYRDKSGNKAVATLARSRINHAPVMNSSVRCSICEKKLEKTESPMQTAIKMGNVSSMQRGKLGTEHLHDYDLWLGTACPACQSIFCPSCVSPGPGSCPKCGNKLVPAQRNFMPWISASIDTVTSDTAIPDNGQLLIVKQNPSPENEREYVEKIIRRSGVEVPSGGISTVYVNDGDFSSIHHQMAIAAEFGRRHTIDVNYEKTNPRIVRDNTYGDVLILDIVPSGESNPEIAQHIFEMKNNRDEHEIEKAIAYLKKFNWTPVTPEDITEFYLGTEEGDRIFNLGSQGILPLLSIIEQCSNYQEFHGRTYFALSYLDTLTNRLSVRRRFPQTGRQFAFFGEAEVERAISILKETITNDNREIRTIAIWALGKFADSESISLLKEIDERDVSKIVSETAARAIEAIQKGADWDAYYHSIQKTFSTWEKFEKEREIPESKVRIKNEHGSFLAHTRGGENSGSEERINDRTIYGISQHFENSKQYSDLYEIFRVFSEEEIENFCMYYSMDKLKLDLNSAMSDNNFGKMSTLLQIFCDYDELTKKYPETFPKKLPSQKYLDILVKRLIPFIAIQNKQQICAASKKEMYTIGLFLIKVGRNKDALVFLEHSYPSIKEDHYFWIASSYCTIAISTKTASDINIAKEKLDDIVKGKIKLRDNYISGAQDMLKQLEDISHG